MYEARVKKLQALLSPTQAILFSTPTDIHYLSRFQFLVPEEREAFFVVTTQTKTLIKNGFCIAPPHPFYDIKQNCKPQAMARHLQEIVTQHHIDEVLVDETNLHLDEFRAVENGVITTTSKPIKITALDKEMMWELRMIKDQEEIEAIRQASHIVSRALVNVRQQLKIGQTENEIAQALEHQLKLEGASGPAFPTIVAFGDHGAEPHYQPDDTSLKPNTPVLIDVGATYKGYRSDMTRSWWFGKNVSPRFAEVEKVVQDAYQAALASLPNVTAKHVDETARKVITDAGYGPNFIHTTGHGVGLDIHEPPSLNWQNEGALRPNMIITIEPGIYLPGEFGYRYENTVLVTKKTGEELTF